MSLSTRALGRRGLEITRVGLGAWAMGGDPARIRRDCDASLRRLGVERIDLYQLHFPPEDGTRLEEAWGARHGVGPGPA
jgi:aryl-alcohol dehydrogenase-like predicted oxidoreductase